MAGMCQQLKCLPGPGGLLDQDSLYIYGMTVVLEAQAEKEDRENRKKR